MTILQRCDRPQRRSNAMACGAILLLALPVGSASAFAGDFADPALLEEISHIRVIDNHCHDDPADAGRGKNWSAQAPLGAPEYPDVAPLRRNDPYWIRAWRALYGYTFNDMEVSHLAQLLETKRQTLKEQGERWPTLVLDRAGVDIVLVNSTQLGAGQHGERFRWVPYADPLLWPFGGEQSRLAYTGGLTSIARLQRELSVPDLPATLADYVERIVGPALAKWRASGAVAVKFLVAYRRTLDFQPVDASRAAAIYTRGLRDEKLDAAEEKALEHYLFFEIAAHAGKVGLVVHIHTGNGNGPYFNNRFAAPGLLETALNSKVLRDTRFVLLHGGWPYVLETQALLDKPNTYADFSAQTFYLTTHALSEVLRSWLGWHPEKVLFGSDAYSDANTPLSDYEEKQWLMTDKSRRALAIALTAMMQDGEVDRERAIEIARQVLRENAAKLYGF